MGNYRERAIGMAKYWARDAHFFHVVFAAFNREDAWGVYQVGAHVLTLLIGCWRVPCIAQLSGSLCK
jgi:hypothetical protein